MEKELYRSKQVIFFILPAMFFFLTFNIYPILKAFQMSFYEWNILMPNESRFVGFKNYLFAFQDPVFWTALRNTILYTLVTVPSQMALGLIVAILLDQNIKGKTFFRTLYYLPVITSWVVVSLLFKYLFNSHAGLVNYILKDVLHLIPSYINWFQEPGTALAVIMLLGIWKGIGWSMVIFLAALQNIPEELKEAAKMDGAGPLTFFWKVTLPLLKPTIVFIAIMLIIGGFNVFISVLLVTGGGPLQKTEVLLTYMYNQGFGNLNFGYGAALSYILGAIIFLISAIQLKLFRKPVDM
jgi:multiple sugar transport system permease protein